MRREKTFVHSPALACGAHLPRTQVPWSVVPFVFESLSNSKQPRQDRFLRMKAIMCLREND